MAKLSMRVLERNRLPGGRFKYMVLLNRNQHAITYSNSNASEIEVLRDMLQGTCTGGYHLAYELNYRKKRVYTHLYLVNPMDLAMIKLAHSEKLFKIYRIEVRQPDELPSKSAQRKASTQK
jgi:hypothetical protein